MKRRKQIQYVNLQKNLVSNSPRRVFDAELARGPSNYSRSYFVHGLPGLSWEFGWHWTSFRWFDQTSGRYFDQFLRYSGFHTPGHRNSTGNYRIDRNLKNPDRKRHFFASFATFFGAKATVFWPQCRCSRLRLLPGTFSEAVFPKNSLRSHIHCTPQLHKQVPSKLFVPNFRSNFDWVDSHRSNTRHILIDV